MLKQETAFISVKFKYTKNGRLLATIKILTKNNIKWRSVSTIDHNAKKELFNEAIKIARKHCDGKIYYQKILL